MKDCSLTTHTHTHTHTHTYIYIYIYRLIGLVGRVFTNGPRDLGSILGRVIPKTLKIVLDTSLPNTQPYKVRIKGKVEQSMCSSYWKESLQVALDYGCQLTYIYIYIYISSDLLFSFS